MITNFSANYLPPKKENGSASNSPAKNGLSNSPAKNGNGNGSSSDNMDSQQQSPMSGFGTGSPMINSRRSVKGGGKNSIFGSINGNMGKKVCPPKTRSSNEPLPQGWTCEFEAKTRQEYYFNHETNESQWERPARTFLKPNVCSLTVKPAEVRPAPTKPKGIDKIKPEEFILLGPFLSIAAGEMRKNQIERPRWQKSPEWVTVRRETGISDEELDNILQDERLDISIELWLSRWSRGKTQEEETRMFQQFESEVIFVAKALCRFDPRCLIECFSERIGLKLPFNKEIVNIICTMCTLIVASRNFDDIRREVRECIR